MKTKTKTSLSVHLPTLFIIGVCMLTVILAWRSAIQTCSRAFSTNKAYSLEANLLSIVEVARTSGAKRVFGLPEKLSPYIFQRMSEMIYPLEYHTPKDDIRPGAGDLCLLLAGGTWIGDTQLLASNRVFKLVRVQP